jgi:sec-independent protein translocase protein TatB
MPQLSPLEILVVSAIALIVFGPEKLPQIARTIGRGISELRRMASDVKQEFEVGLDIDDDDEDDRPRVHRPTRRSTGASAEGEGDTALSESDTEGNEGAAPGAKADPNDPPPTEASSP